jgi:hypothetical protein
MMIAQTVESGDEGIRSVAFEKNSSVNGGMSDVSISLSLIASSLAQLVLDVLLIMSPPN